MKAGRRALLGLLAAAACGAAATQGSAQRGQDRLDGIWDLTWTTRRGPQQKGYLVLRQNGGEVRGEIHGRGNVSARGTVNGHNFVLRGSRMMVPYRIEGRWDGDRLEGALKVLSVDRRFTGIRRRSATAR